VVFPLWVKNSKTLRNVSELTSKTLIFVVGDQRYKVLKE
jgi:hypothetical protein